MRSALKKIMILVYLVAVLAILPSCQPNPDSGEETPQNELADTSTIAWINYKGYDYYGYVEGGKIVEVDCPVGTKGPTGGLIFYDVDADNDDFDNDGLASWECGYRYLEAAPTLLHLIDGQPSVDRTDPKFASGTTTFIQSYYRTSASGSNLRFNSTETYHPWNCTEDDIGTGLENTELMVLRLGTSGENAYTTKTGSTHTNLYAALLCYNLEYTAANGVTYCDWFLPSVMELHAATWNLTGITGTPIYENDGRTYNSSSEKSEATFTSGSATVNGVDYMHNLNTSGVKSASKLRDTSLPVLPIRHVQCPVSEISTEKNIIPANTKTFSVGDVGPAGGYVIYDKGSYSDGWRYLEVSPTNLVIGNDGNPTLRSLAGSIGSSYTPSKYINKPASVTNGISSKYFVGCYYRKEGFGSNLFVNGTTSYSSSCTAKGIGTGSENTEKLVEVMWSSGRNAFTKVSNSEIFLSYFPAHICRELEVTRGGVVYDDWFLPSIEELELVGNLPDSIKAKLLDADYSCWSSSEVQSSAGQMYSFNITSKEITEKDRNKRIFVLAVRRF